MSRLLLGFLLTASFVSAQDSDLASRAVTLLEQRCFGCHGASLSQSGLRLDSREAALRGGARGSAIVAGKASRGPGGCHLPGPRAIPAPPAPTSRRPKHKTGKHTAEIPAPAFLVFPPF